MKLTKKHKGGFTAVELMVTMVAFSVMVTAVGAILVTTWQSWADNRRTVSMQRDATAAMRIIARELRRTPIASGGFSITVGNPLTCVNTNGTIIFRQSGRDFEMQNAGGTVITLADNICTRFDSIITNGAVRVELDLATATDSSETTITIYPRN